MRKKVKRILALLNKMYGRPEPFKKSNPIDELIRTILSQNTTDKNSLAAFRILKDNFDSWGGLLRTDTRRIAFFIKSSGLANIKAKRIKGVLNEIKKREGRLDLSSLKDMGTDEAVNYLRSLRGIGPKTTACVLLFSFGKPIMPVDTHIFRVAKRLALIGKHVNIDEAHSLLTKLVPKDLIYDFHLGIIEHGRKTCKAQNPKCGICALYNLCRFERKSFFRKRGLS